MNLLNKVSQNHLLVPFVKVLPFFIQLLSHPGIQSLSVSQTQGP